MDMDGAAPDCPRFATAQDVAWITEGTSCGLTIDSAIPLLFGAYATIDPTSPEGTDLDDLEALLGLLRSRSADHDWWLGYIDTGGEGLPYPGAPMVSLYANWNYVMALAGPPEASAWRFDRGSPGPDLIFPTDRSWLLSRLWDDEWRCLGGPTALIEEVVADGRFHARRVRPGDDATPPGRVAR
jgi:hypothetical protein